MTVAPNLGPCPSKIQSKAQWHSWMTDDGGPVELSWDWGYGDSSTMIRYAFEPVSRMAGTSLDPHNSFAGDDATARISAIYPNTNLAWHNHFRQQLTDAHLDEGVIKDQALKSRFGIAFDLSGEDVLLKTYFVPELKATLEHKSTLQVTLDAVTSLTGYDRTAFRSFHTLVDFIVSTQQTLGLVLEIVAVDCDKPEDSRLKIYVRSRSTSFASVRRVLSLDGKASEHVTPSAVNELRNLWRTLFRQRGDDNEQLPYNGYRFAGTLYVFEVRLGEDLAVPKIYLPVRHYCTDDLHIAQTVSDFHTVQGQGEKAERFMALMRTEFGTRRLRNNIGVQTYVGCTIRKSALKIISYLNPQCYRGTSVG